MATVWRKAYSIAEPGRWVWVMPNPTFAGRWGEWEYWTNVLAPDDNHAYWTYGIDARNVVLRGRAAKNLRLITYDEWKAGIHGHEKENHDGNYR